MYKKYNATKSKVFWIDWSSWHNFTLVNEKCVRVDEHGVCVCVCHKEKSARRMASITSDTSDTSSKQQQAQRKGKGKFH